MTLYKEEKKRIGSARWAIMTAILVFDILFLSDTDAGDSGIKKAGKGISAAFLYHQYFWSCLFCLLLESEVVLYQRAWKECVHDSEIRDTSDSEKNVVFCKTPHSGRAAFRTACRKCGSVSFSVFRKSARQT